MQHPQTETVTIDDVLITEELFQRSPRPPNWQAEAQAMQPLAQQMARDSESLLQTLVEIALELCQAGTAGASLLETTTDGEEVFRWHVLAGTLAQYVGGTTPRNFSPCGVCLERSAPVLFYHPERYFTYFQAANTPIIEGLVLPLIVDNHALGTIWIMSHDQQRHFDSEDVRMMTSLADFTATALLLKQRQTGELLAANAVLEAEIAERKQTEAQLGEAQRRLELSLTGANLGIWTYRVGTDEFWADDRAKQMHGHEPHEVHTFAEAGANIHPEDRDRAQAAFAQAIQNCSKLQIEYRVIWHDGSVHGIGSYAEFMPTGDQDKGIFYGVVQDISDRLRLEGDRKRAEAALRESEERSLALIENLPGGAAFVVDHDLRYLLAEGEALSTAGFKPEDLVGYTIFEVLPPELTTQYEKLYRQALAGEPFEHEHNAHDRSYISRGTPLRSANGEIYAVLAVSYDISERKKAEESLRESEEKYRLLFESIDEGYALCELIYDETGPINWRFLEVNPSFEHLTGFTNAVGKTATELNQTPSSDWLETFGQVAQTGESARFEEYIESIDYWFDLHASRLDEDSRHIVVVFNNITDRKRAEVQLRRAAELDAFRVKLGDALRSLSDPIQIQAEACRLLGEHLGVDRAYYAEINEAEDYSRIDQNYLRGDSPSVVGVFRLADYGWVVPILQRGETIIVADAENSDLVPESDQNAMRAVQLTAVVGIPLVKAGVLVGALTITEPKPREWTDIEIELTRETAERIWAAIERTRAEQTLHESEERQAFLLKLDDALRPLADPAEIQSTASRLLGERLGASRVLYVGVEGEGDAVEGLVRGEFVREGAPFPERFPYSAFTGGFTDEALRSGKALITSDTTHDPWVDEDVRRAWLQADVAAVVAVALVKGGRFAGIFGVHHARAHDWTPGEVALIEEVAERTWDAAERARAEAARRESEIQRIREQSAREEERQRAEALAELDRAKTIFFSNISHEFRTPLTLSLAPLQDVLSDVAHPLDPVNRERIELAHRNALRLLKLVNTLLDFSRIEAGRMEAVYEPTDLALFTTELASVFRSAIERAGLRLIVDCPPLPEPVYVDREMWEKILLNLLSNAFKFTFEGEIIVSLRAELSAELQTSTSNVYGFTSEPQTPSSDLGSLTSELETSPSELETSPSELETSPLEHGISSSELETSPSELGGSRTELKTQNIPYGNATRTKLHPLPHVVLEVRDTGTGIAPEELPHLFEQFYQVRGAQARTHEGSGIGLALVHELIRLHGGTINVNSTVGEGTCFTITLPFGTKHLPSDHLRHDKAERNKAHTLTSTGASTALYVEEARWLHADSDPPKPPLERGENSVKVPLFKGDLGGSPKLKDPTPASACILLVDDNADMRDYLTRILSEHVQVEAVADGAAVLAVAQARVPDLVLSDVMMPGLDGFQLLKALQADPRTRGVPILLLSARAGEESVVEGLEAGADDYLIKPFSAQELVSRVNAHLQMAQLRSEALHQERITSRRKDELLSTVSHELNTPLVAILGWTRLLRADPSNQSMLMKSLETIERNATLQAKLIQDLLDITRIEAGKLRLHLQPVKVESVIKAAIAAVLTAAIAKDIDLQYKPGCQESGKPNNQDIASVSVLGDRDRLQQVICNLLTNAIKFTPKLGNVMVEFSVIEAETPSYAEIRVIDTGTGISAEFLPHVFDRFRQAEHSGSASGLGLGLAIARHLVELHNGTICVASDGADKGTTFIIKLPLLRENQVLSDQS